MIIFFMLNEWLCKTAVFKVNIFKFYKIKVTSIVLFFMIYNKLIVSKILFVLKKSLTLPTSVLNFYACARQILHYELM